MAAVCCASTRRRAMVARRFDMRSRVFAARARRRCRARAAAGAGRGLAAGSPRRAAPALRRERLRGAAARRTSPLVTRGPLARHGLELHVVCSGHVAGRRAWRGCRPRRPRQRAAGTRPGGRGRCGRRRRGAAPALSSSTAEHLAHLHVVALGVRDGLQHAGAIGADLEVDLLGLELDQRVAGGDRDRPPSSATAPRALRRPTRRVREPRCWLHMRPRFLTLCFERLRDRVRLADRAFCSNAWSTSARWLTRVPAPPTLPPGSSCAAGRRSAAASRPSISSSSSGRTNSHAPMFSGSSCTQHTSRSFG